MIFTLIIRSHPLTNQGSQSAYQFANAIYHQGHSINCVFFYQQGVYHAQEMILPADEPNISQLWLELADKHQFKLNACVTACEKRGITNPTFPIAGLGQLASYMLEADSTVEF
ncbi:sulfurtransferase complex subunit TusD [Thiotrichales bacterium 19S11-10]|nr:sulfurtransferase complex subunit TusD [Thiotrichales bacterium 19S11-10]MCF6807345.1 sulfurtransferase complex subunit TusD [Thiotrichales bacterium 19S9-11]MCF6811314.1 sulfurtransferase complex subunit TusD [Thiotrichales bacterium 19S9-12]